MSRITGLRSPNNNTMSYEVVNAIFGVPAGGTNAAPFLIYGTTVRLINIAVNGPNGRDQLAAFAPADEVHFYLCVDRANPATLQGRVSLSPPQSFAAPAGTDGVMYLGTIKLDANAQIPAVAQKGKEIFYNNGMNDCGVLNGGAAVGNPPLDPVDISAFVPTIAEAVQLRIVGVNSATAAMGHLIGVANPDLFYTLLSNPGDFVDGVIYVPLINTAPPTIFYDNELAGGSMWINVMSYTVPAAP